VRKLLRESGVEFEEVDYTVDRLSKTKLRELVRKTGLEARDMLRKREAAYKQLNLADPEISDAKILDAMVEHPELIQRPIVVRGKQAVLARPVERVLEIL
jgi:arsenate reductase